MKLNLKVIAAAAAMAAASGAHADLTANNTGNSSLAFVAFNAVTNSYYYRDLGYALNSFLPNAVTTTPADGGGSSVTGDKTPEAGFNQVWGAGNFATWLAGQASQGDVRWTIAAGDSATTAGGVGPGAVNGVGGSVPLGFLSNNGFGSSTLSLLGGVANLFYYTTTTGGGALGSTSASSTVFSNTLNTATLSLATNGVLTYNLDAAGAPAAVPVPAAAWLLGSGLLAFGGMVRRHKASAAAA